MEKVRIAAVSTASFDGDEDYKNAEQAQAYVEEAAKNNAQLICFPEGYPGPCFGPMDSGGHLAKTPVEMLCDSARQHNVHISCGNLEESQEIPGAYYLTNKLISPKGEILANYKRCQPTTPIVNAALYGGKKHLLPGKELMVVDTKLGRIGLLICSELFVPELARIEMLMGAEIILAPVGGSHRGIRMGASQAVGGGQLSTWQCLARARAAENLLYVITSVNTFSPEQRRGSFVASPEKTLGVSEGAGILYATLDMERLWYLRSRYEEEEDVSPLSEGPSNYEPRLTKFGNIHYRRPDFYRKLVEPQPDAYDYFYHKRGLDTWKEEYEKVHKFTRTPSATRSL
ncbi:carbon-nitrogen hydrolase family protein [Chloroflexota bacterium]